MLKELASGRLAMINSPRFDAARHVQLSTRKRSRPTRDANNFRDVLMSYLSA
ncbi:hypothetical protein [Croceicoccus sp. Ery15]|uniref:hypothetical protein n=1 Tax=Croceicoccus sp. Ery15 TaxID=1703338 RepID=UPI001E3936FE|nr:hypothetical protein [Croceicoccus sp. Ery15]